MTWLMTHMWIVAVTASAVALLLGWSIRGMLLSGKMRQAVVERDVAKLELNDTKDELEKLFAQIRKLQNGEAASTPAADPILLRKVESLTAELARKSAEIEALKAAASGAAAAASPATSPAAREGQVEDTLVWRNRHLESRVVHLESELAKTRSALPAAVPSPQADTAGINSAKLDWEVKYLRTRVEALQTELAAVPRPVPAISAAAAVAAVEPGSPVEEELARLRWRVRQLEGRLAYFEGDAEAAAEGAAAAAGAEQAASAAPAKSVAENILSQLEAADKAADAEAARAPMPVRPQPMEKPIMARADDLTLIGGIGPKIRDLLHDLGIFHFEQIAGWTPENVAWVDEHLGFSGRITREGWVEQARVLAGEAADA